MRQHRARGFTLLEAIVVTVILAFVAIMASELFLTAAQQGKQVSIQSDFLTQVATAMSQIRRDLRNASASVPSHWPGATPAPSQTFQPMVCYTSTSAELVPPLIPNGHTPYTHNEITAGPLAGSTYNNWTVPIATGALNTLSSPASLGNPNSGAQVATGVYRGDTLYYWAPTGFATAGTSADTVTWGNGPIVYMFVPMTNPTAGNPLTATTVFSLPTTVTGGVTYTNLGNPFAKGVNSVGQGPNVAIPAASFPKDSGGNYHGLSWTAIGNQPSFLQALYNYHDAASAPGSQPIRLFELVRIDFNTTIPNPASTTGAMMPNPNSGVPVLLVPQIENWPYATTSSTTGPGATSDYPYFEVDTTSSPGIKITVCFRVVNGAHEKGAKNWTLYSQAFCESFTLQP